MATLLIAAPIGEPITLAEAKRHINYVDDPASPVQAQDDAAMLAMIKVARMRCEHLTGRALMTQTRELRLDAFPSGAIRLDWPPAQSIVTVGYVRASDGLLVYVNSGDYSLDSLTLPGWVVNRSGTTWPSDVADAPGAVRVRFGCGYGDADEVPEELRQWIKLRFADLWDNRGTQTADKLADVAGADALLDAYAWMRL